MKYVHRHYRDHFFVTFFNDYTFFVSLFFFKTIREFLLNESTLRNVNEWKTEKRQNWKKKLYKHNITNAFLFLLELNVITSKNKIKHKAKHFFSEMVCWLSEILNWIMGILWIFFFLWVITHHLDGSFSSF